MFCFSACIFCDPHRTDEPELPKFLCDIIAAWMHEHDVNALHLSLDEVSDDEQ